MDPDYLREEKRYLQTFKQPDQEEQTKSEAEEEQELEELEKQDQSDLPDVEKLRLLKARLKEKNELLMMTP